MSKSKTHDSATSTKDVLYFFILNVASAFMLSAAHNVLYFVLDIRAPVIHFLHHFSAFCFMLFISKLGCIPRAVLPLKPFAVPVGLKVLEVLLASIVHSGNRTGGLYLIRVFDFLFTITIIFVGNHYLPTRTEGKPKASMVVQLGLACSLSWLEWGQLEYTSFSLLCAPLLAIVRGLTVLSIQKTHIELQSGHTELFCLYYTGLVSAGLLLPTFVSYSYSHVLVTASWESIDYVLMGLSFMFMSCHCYSELWLLLQLNIRAYTTLEHSKFLLASVGQWIIQNMAHPNILALGGKTLAAACLFRIAANL